MKKQVGKKATIACDACKKRKTKCNGIAPCTYCIANEMSCSFSSVPQIRGPKKKQKTNTHRECSFTIDKREIGMLAETELNSYMEMYLRYVDPLHTMLGQRDHGAHVVQLLHPRSPSQFIIKYAACARMARLLGLHDRANSLVSSATALTSHAFLDMSVDGMFAFLLLAVLGNDNPCLGPHFYNIATSIFKLHNPSMIPISVRSMFILYSVLRNDDIDESDKLPVYFKKVKLIEPQNNYEQLSSHLRHLRLTAFAHLRCCDDEHLRIDIMAAFSCKVIYSIEQREHHLNDLQTCRNLAAMSYGTNSDKTISESLTMMFNSIEIFIEWRSGNSERALPLAISLASDCSFERARFCTPERQRFDVLVFLMISIFLYENHQQSLAIKMQQIAQSLFSCIDTIQTATTRSSSEKLADFISSKPTHSLSGSQPDAVESVFAFLSTFFPSPSDKLLSAHSLHAMCSSSSFLPYFPSLFKLDTSVCDVSSATFPAPPSSIDVFYVNNNQCSNNNNINNEEDSITNNLNNETTTNLSELKSPSHASLSAFTQENTFPLNIDDHDWLTEIMNT